MKKKNYFIIFLLFFTLILFLVWESQKYLQINYKKSLPNIQQKFPSISAAIPTSIINKSTLLQTPSSQVLIPSHNSLNDAMKTCNNLLVLVDRNNTLSSDYSPSDLVYLQINGIPATSGSLMVRKILIEDLKNLFEDANKANINLIVASPYRSYNTQLSVYDSYVKQYGRMQADQFSAHPGASQHQLGTAIDFSTDEIANQIDQSFSQTKAGKWLAENAYLYGFYISYPQGQQTVTGYEYEPWHFRYLNRENTLDLKRSGLIMQTYLEKKGIKPNC